MGIDLMGLDSMSTNSLSPIFWFCMGSITVFVTYIIYDYIKSNNKDEWTYSLLQYVYTENPPVQPTRGSSGLSIYVKVGVHKEYTPNIKLTLRSHYYSINFSHLHF